MKTISDELFKKIMKYIKDRSIHGSWFNDRRTYDLINEIENGQKAQPAVSTAPPGR